MHLLTMTETLVYLHSHVADHLKKLAKKPSSKRFLSGCNPTQESLATTALQTHAAESLKSKSLAATPYSFSETLTLTSLRSSTSVT